MRETLSRMEEEREEIVSRKKWVHGILLIAGLLLGTRLWLLQVVQGEKLRTYSEMNRLKEVQVPAERGLILDRNNQVLVENLINLELKIIPQYIKDLPKTAQNIAPIIQTDPDLIIKKVQKSERQYGPFRPVVIKKHLSLKEVPLLRQIQWNHTGVDIEPTLVRHYPLKENGAHLFGYLGEITKKKMEQLNKKSPFMFSLGDRIGKAGLESVWENTLKGENGFSFIEVDAKNQRPLSSIAELWGLKPKEAKAGKSLILTLDKNLQEQAYLSFFRKDKIGPRQGSAVVLKKNGEILAWVSLPSFDPNVFSLGISPLKWQILKNDPKKPLINKVIQSHYAPGSVFKPFVALAGLQNQVITEEQLIHSPSQIKFGNRIYHDYQKTGHGNINIESALERSANVFFYKLGIKLGIDKMARFARAFNLGQKTFINIDGELAGLIPDSQWKLKQTGVPWQGGEDLVHAIGQGFTLVTPLQMAVAYNSLAQNGAMITPFIVQKIVDSQGNTLKSFSASPTKFISMIDQEHFKTIKKALIKVTQGARGTARWWKLKGGITMAGKTGTSQVRSFSKDQIHKKCHNRPLKQRHHGWFVAFAPAKNPEITVAVLTEHSCSGSSGSAPIARDIIQAYFSTMNNGQ